MVLELLCRRMMFSPSLSLFLSLSFCFSVANPDDFRCESRKKLMHYGNAWIYINLVGEKNVSAFKFSKFRACCFSLGSSLPSLYLIPHYLVKFSFFIRCLQRAVVLQGPVVGPLEYHFRYMGDFFLALTSILSYSPILAVFPSRHIILRRFMSDANHF